MRQQGRHVVHGRLLTVHYPESVGNKRAAGARWAADQLGQFLRERETLCVVLAGLPGVESDVLQ
ncbi:Uncharacterised protein [Mycobacteroides abscessus subsp. massiliense]|nr:Uncharacterised protein [Mycobacteroides abscessus subsp. massiliense]